MKSGFFVTSCLFLTMIVQATGPVDSAVEKSVTVMSAERLQFFPSRSAPATVVSLNQSQIAAEVMARVKRINVLVGQSVKRGQLLVELDCTEMELSLKGQQARLKQLKSQFDFDERQLARGAALAQKKNLGEADLDRRETAVLTTESQLTLQQANTDIAKLNVSRCQIKSPYDGVVLRRLVNEGEMARQGQAVVELLQLEQQEVSAKIPTTDMPSFLKAASYELQMSEESKPLKFRVLLPLVENFASSREARLEFVKESYISGANGRVIWHSSITHLPAYLLQVRNGEPGIFIEEQNTARFIKLPRAQEGRPIPFSTALLKLSANANVIIDGRQGLVDGDMIHWQVESPVGDGGVQ